MLTFKQTKTLSNVILSYENTLKYKNLPEVQFNLGNLELEVFDDPEKAHEMLMHNAEHMSTESKLEVLKHISAIPKDVVDQVITAKLFQIQFSLMWG